MKDKDIIQAWATIREENNTIPDEVLDFMKDAALSLLNSTPNVEVSENKINNDDTDKKLWKFPN
jgi:hypothetical protein